MKTPSHRNKERAGNTAPQKEPSQTWAGLVILAFMALGLVSGYFLFK